MNNIQNNSYYRENYKISFSDYIGPDFSKICFIFPGQGAAKPGMLKNEIKRWPNVLELIKIADSLCEEAKIPTVSQFIFNPETLNKELLPLIQNISHLTIQVGFFQSLINYNKIPSVLTAHSFGEYPMLCAAGVINFNDIFQIVLKREQCSPALDEIGTMIVATTSLENFNKLINSELKNFSIDSFYIANENSKNQIAISCNLKIADELVKTLKKNKIIAKKLPTVGRPYHGHLMEAAKNKFVAEVEKLQIKTYPSKYDFISSVDGNFYEQGHVFDQKAIIELLTLQLTKPCYFKKQIESAFEHKNVSFLELGETNIYLSFIDDTLVKNNFSSLNILDCLPYEKISENKTYSIDVENSLVFKSLSKYINKVTGFNFLEVSIFDKFQEDLRIDSIKKAEIIFKTLQESKVQIDESITLAQLQSVGDTVEFLEKIKSNPKLGSSKSVEVVPITNFEVKKSLAPLISLPVNLDNQKTPLNVSHFTDNFQLHFNSPNFSAKDKLIKVQLALPENYTEFNFDHLLNLSNSLNKLSSYLKTLDHFIEITFIQKEHLSHFETLKPFLKSYCKENGFFFKSIHLDKFSSLEEILRAEQNEDQLIDVYYSNGIRYSSTFEHVAIQSQNFNFKHILIIGGASGLGLNYFLSMSEKYPNCHFSILGRRDINQTELKSQDQNKFTYLKADAESLNIDQLKNLINKNGNIDLIVNSAGVGIDKELKNFTDDELYTVYKSKINVTDNLTKIAKTLNVKLINFSSIVGFLGNQGQTIYSFANSYQLRKSDASNIAWPGIEELGMTENLGILHKLRNTGIALLPKAELAKWFEWITTTTPKDNQFLLALKDSVIMEMDVRDFNPTKDVLGEIASMDNLTFRRNFNLKNDYFLRDHVLESSILLPASYALASGFYTSRFLHKDFGDIHQFSIKNMMIIPNDADVISYFKFQINNDASVNFQLTSQIEHFEFKLKKPEKGLHNIKFNAKKFDQKIVMNTFYFEKCIAFGDKFKVMTDAYFNSNNNDIIAIRKGNIIEMTGNNTVDSIINILELGFQTGSLLGLILNKGLAIPQNIKKIIIEKLDYKELYSTPEIIVANLDSYELPLILNINIFNEKKECIVRIEEIEIVPIRKDEILPFKLEPFNRDFLNEL